MQHLSPPSYSLSNTLTGTLAIPLIIPVKPELCVLGVKVKVKIHYEGFKKSQERKAQKDDQFVSVVNMYFCT